jgi:hypothetical protein
MEQAKAHKVSESETEVYKEEMSKAVGAVSSDGTAEIGDDGLMRLLDQLTFVVSSFTCSAYHAS